MSDDVNLGLHTLPDIILQVEQLLGREAFLAATLRVKAGPAPDEKDRYTLFMEIHSPCDKADHTTCAIPFTMDCATTWDTFDEAKKVGEEIGEILQKAGSKVAYYSN